MLKLIESYYLDFVNNFITLSAFSEHHDITEQQASDIINLGRQFNERLAFEQFID